MSTTQELIRYYGPKGWQHFVVVRRGRKWVNVRMLFRQANKEGKMVYRRRRVRLADCDAPLWGVR